MRILCFVSVGVVLAACGGASQEATDPHTEAANSDAPLVSPPKRSTPKPAAVEVKEEPKVLPTTCTADASGLCVPDPAFVKRLCDGSNPDIALVMMAKGTPWTRAYLKGDVDGWNAEGAMSTRAKLVFDEEVLVLKKREAAKTGIVINGGGGATYQVLRWDGNCFTLSDGEITMRHPPKAKSPAIAWKYLSPRIRDALLENATIKKAYDTRGHDCGGSSSGDVPIACLRSDEALSRTIVDQLRGGVSLPTPDRIP